VNNDDAQLGIVPANERLTAKVCVARGQRWVNWPVRIIMFGGLLAIVVILKYVPLPTHNNLPGWLNLTLALLFLLSPIILAWLWWSWTITDWRIWALQHADSWPDVELLAIADLLIWPRGSIFEKTEIKWAEKRKLEQALIAKRDEEYEEDSEN
jgi:hypothetical protein